MLGRVVVQESVMTSGSNGRTVHVRGLESLCELCRIEFASQIRQVLAGVIIKSNLPATNHT